MSRELISRSRDLQRLQAEGYEINVVAGHLLVRHVPYVTSQGVVKYGALVSTLDLAGERTSRPSTHVVHFVGEQPCHRDGQVIQQIENEVARRQLAEGLEIDRSFSNKPPGGYRDYYDKMTAYARIISGPAESLDPSATAKTFIVDTTDDSPVFEYTDTATARAEIGTVSAKLEGYKIAIVGLGGTGAYILDLVAKTPVTEIHLFDRDRFLQHNAFRSPGAPSLEELRESPYKVEYFSATYSRMHKGIKAHAIHIDEENAEVLASMDFVFVCVDRAQSRKVLIEALRRYDQPFIDVGMGLETVNESLVGTLRVSVSTPDHRTGERRIPTTDIDPGQGNDYSNNIQIADLNCLNASLAVVRWKKLCGFYQDLEREHFAAYAINVNQLASAEQSNEAS